MVQAEQTSHQQQRKRFMGKMKPGVTTEWLCRVMIFEEKTSIGQRDAGVFVVPRMDADGGRLTDFIGLK